MKIVMVRKMILNVCLVAGMAVLGSCELEGTSPGSVQLPLTGVGDSGETYRLRDGTFKIQGAENATLSTEDHLGDTSMSQELAEGDYIVKLNPGWSLEKQVDGVFEPVDAVLLSSNPQGFSIEDQQTTTVIFRFKAGDDVVELGDGILEIIMEVEDDDCYPPEWSDEEDQELLDGVIVSNWTLDGYIDANGDGHAEETEVEFSLEDILCDGVGMLVFTHCDTICPPCADWLTGLAAVEDDINAAGGAILAVVTESWSTQAIADVHAYLDGYGIEGRYMSGELPSIEYEFVPFTAVIDLETGEVLHADEIGSSLTPAEILEMVEDSE